MREIEFNVKMNTIIARVRGLMLAHDSCVIDAWTLYRFYLETYAPDVLIDGKYIDITFMYTTHKGSNGHGLPSFESIARARRALLSKEFTSFASALSRHLPTYYANTRPSEELEKLYRKYFSTYKEEK